MQSPARTERMASAVFIEIQSRHKRQKKGGRVYVVYHHWNPCDSRHRNPVFRIQEGSAGYGFHHFRYEKEDHHRQGQRENSVSGTDGQAEPEADRHRRENHQCGSYCGLHQHPGGCSGQREDFQRSAEAGAGCGELPESEYPVYRKYRQRGSGRKYA